MISSRIAYDILIIQTLTLTPPMIPPAPEITPPCHTTPVFLVSHVPAYPLLPTATHCQASFAMNAAFYSETDNDWSTDRWRVALRWRCISWTIWIQFVEIVSQLHLSGGQSCFDHKWVIKAGILSRAGNELSQLTPAHIILTPVPGTWMINFLWIFLEANISLLLVSDDVMDLLSRYEHVVWRVITGWKASTAQNCWEQPLKCHQSWMFQMADWSQ